MAGYETILVPYDFSDHSVAALRVASELAERLGSRIHLLHVIRPVALAYPTWRGMGGAAPEMLTEIQRGAEEALTDVAARTNADGQVLVGASVADTIRDVAQKVGADLIVMGTHGRTGLAHAFLGSNAERTLRQAPCPVVTVRAPES